jgi:hypothetical protein
MHYEFLVIAQSREGGTAQPGDLVAFKLKGSTWGKKEVAPRFARIPFEGTENEARHILANCRFSASTGDFVYKEKKEQDALATHELVPAKTTYTKELFTKLTEKPVATDYADAELDKLEAQKVTGETLSSQAGMAYLWPKHRATVDCSTSNGQAILAVRRFWLKLFWPERADPAVRELVNVIKNHGRLGAMRRAAFQVPQRIWSKLLPSIPEADRQWLRQIWKIGIDDGDSRDNR